MSDPLPTEPARRSSAAAWVKFVLRWGIAVVGITWVVSGLTIRDRVHVLTPDPGGVSVVLDAPLADDARTYTDPVTGSNRTAPADVFLNGPDRRYVTVAEGGQAVRLRVAGMRLIELPAPADSRRPRLDPLVAELWVFDPDPPAEADPQYAGLHVRQVSPLEVAGGFSPTPPQPVVRTGLASMVRDARPALLVAAVLVFPVTLVCTGLRWWTLMIPLGIRINLARAYVLNMVGLFYNSFMLGSTGGDFIKAFYAGKHAPRGRKAAAWLSVFVDRVIGLLVLALIGGTAAAIQYALTPDKDSQVAVACLQVATASFALLGGVGLALFVALHAPVRRRSGLSGGVKKVLGSLPGGREGGKLRTTLDEVYDAVETYARRPWTVAAACLLTVPVHGSVIVSAMLAGVAFDLPIPWPYYFVVVPVVVLAASMPVSPQGAGVMEFFAVLLTRPLGATVSQAFALALSIRVVQILWNLTGGILVLRGGYSGPPPHAATNDTDPAGDRKSHPKTHRTGRSAGASSLANTQPPDLPP